MRMYNLGYAYGKKEFAISNLKKMELGNFLIITNDKKYKRKILKNINEKYSKYVLLIGEEISEDLCPQVILFDGEIVMNNKRLIKFLDKAEMIITIRNTSDFSEMNSELSKRYIR